MKSENFYSFPFECKNLYTVENDLLSKCNQKCAQLRALHNRGMHSSGSALKLRGIASPPNYH